MITFATPLPVGNAVSVGLSPPTGSALTQVQRNTTGAFAGANDPAATIVFQDLDSGFTDFIGLKNGTAYSYGEFNLIGGQWVAGDVVSATPNASETLVSADPLTVVRDRLKAGLAIEVQAGRLQHATGAIPVYTAPPVYSETQWPVVSVHLRADSLSQRGIGEDIWGDELDAISGTWGSSEGGLSEVALDVYSWALNADVRIALRTSIKRVLLANLPVFEAAGLMQVGFSQSDIEDFESYNAPVYQSVTSFSCLAPSVVTASLGSPLGDVTVNAVSPL